MRSTSGRSTSDYPERPGLAVSSVGRLAPSNEIVSDAGVGVIEPGVWFGATRVVVASGSISFRSSRTGCGTRCPGKSPRGSTALTDTRRSDRSGRSAAQSSRAGHQRRRGRTALWQSRSRRCSSGIAVS
jgi:hypothetical protein